MGLNVGKELAALRRMSVGELRWRYGEVFGDTTNAKHKDWLVKRIIWRMQALAEGDLSERARRQAAELANDADLQRWRPSRRPLCPVRRRGRARAARARHLSRHAGAQRLGWWDTHPGHPLDHRRRLRALGPAAARPHSPSPISIATALSTFTSPPIARTIFAIARASISSALAAK